MVTSETLFSGDPGSFFGGLFNERDLAEACPDEFRQANDWSTYAMKLFFNSVSIANWKWRSNDKEERRRQHDCFRALLGTFVLSNEDKEAVAGWMLSEMLTEVPEYVPG